MRNRVGQYISRLTTIALLSALGTLLMMFAKIPYLPAPWCEIEFSDTVILIAYALYGAYGALACAFIKTLFSFIFQGVGFMGIGQIAALLASLTYTLGLFLTSHVFKLFKKGFGFRLIGYIFIIFLVTLVLTLANFIFITPTYAEGAWATCFNSEAVKSIVENYGAFGSGYALIIMAIYVPFNALKGLLVCLAYELIFNRLIFVLLSRSPFAQKYFIGGVKKKRNIEETEPAKEEKKPLEKEEKKTDSDSYLDKLTKSGK